MTGVENKQDSILSISILYSHCIMHINANYQVAPAGASG